MYMRLGFAVAVNVDPDVLLVDEVLAVGDEAFTHRCFDKLAEFRRRGRTVLLVTHALDLVTRFCDEALWLDAGVVREQGDPKRVVDAYLMDVSRGENETMAREAVALEMPLGDVDDVGLGAEARPHADEPADMFKATEGRWGTREAEIVAVELRGADGAAAHVFQSGDALDVRIRVRAYQPLTDFVFGVGIFNADGVCCYGTNTSIEGATPESMSGDGEVGMHFARLDLIDGTYRLDVAVHRQNGAPYDYHRLLYTFRVTSRLKDTGIYRPVHRWTFGGGIRVSGL
jgi:hypothetical protein